MKYSIYLYANAKQDLLKAAETGKINDVKKALANGAKVNAKNTMEETALIKASWNGYLDIVKLLIKKGAK